MPNPQITGCVFGIVHTYGTDGYYGGGGLGSGAGGGVLFNGCRLGVLSRGVLGLDGWLIGLVGQAFLFGWLVHGLVLGLFGISISISICISICICICIFICICICIYNIVI